VIALQNQSLTERTSRLVHIVNQLIADIESDLSAPGEAAFHAKAAYASLREADLALRDAIAERARSHYESIVRDASMVTPPSHVVPLFSGFDRDGQPMYCSRAECGCSWSTDLKNRLHACSLHRRKRLGIAA